MVEMPDEEKKDPLPLWKETPEEKQKLIERRKKRLKKYTRYKWLLFLALAGFIYLTIGCFFIPRILHPVIYPVYFSIPIDLSKAGNSAEKKLRICCEDYYGLELRFESTQKSALTFDNLRTFLGFHTPMGTNIPIRVKIVKLQGWKQIPIIDQIYMTNGVHSWVSGSVTRNFGGTSLEPGKYKFLIESIDDFPELSQTPVRLRMSYSRAK